jgi:hypothetical protein
MTEAALFHRCRKALGLSQPAVAQALLIASDRTIRRWEQDELMVAGPAWVALEYLLRESAHLVGAGRGSGPGRVHMCPNGAPSDTDKGLLLLRYLGSPQNRHSGTGVMAGERRQMGRFGRFCPVWLPPECVGLSKIPTITAF